MQKKIKGFLALNKQNTQFNQYWYSPKSINFLAQQVINQQSICFLSTPSIYYCLDNNQYIKPYYLFDLDQKFSKNNPNYFKYDFNQPQSIPHKFYNFFYCVVADPPFITVEVWQKYAQAIHKIIKKDQHGNIIGKIILSTIDQNQKNLSTLLGVTKRKWKPSIPHLVYQYSLYTNYQNDALNNQNQQLPSQ